MRCRDLTIICWRTGRFFEALQAQRPRLHTLHSISYCHDWSTTGAKAQVPRLHLSSWIRRRGRNKMLQSNLPHFYTCIRGKGRESNISILPNGSNYTISCKGMACGDKRMTHSRFSTTIGAKGEVTPTFHSSRNCHESCAMAEIKGFVSFVAG